MQVYTHPLWMLLHLAGSYLITHIVLLTLILSLTCITAAVGLAARRLPLSPLLVAAGFVAPLALSYSVSLYSSSGLENPLTLLCFALVLHLLLKPRNNGWFLVPFIVSLALLTRLDSALFYAPLGIWFLWRNRPIRWRKLMLSLLPLIAWYAFSLWYYGFLFPTTAYAKLNSVVPRLDLLSQGLSYVLNFIIADPVGFLLIAAGTIGSVLHAHAGRENASLYLAILAGVYAYVAYIVYIGGDFMTGRFMTLPVFACAWLAAATLLPRRSSRHLFMILLLLLALRIFSVPMLAAWENCEDCFGRGKWISDESKFYGENNIFRHGWLQPQLDPEHPFAAWGRYIRANEMPVVTIGAVGMMAYFAGPRTHFIDPFAVAEPLLSRLPHTLVNWRPGHMRREMPLGYIYFRQTGDMSHMHPALVEYLTQLQLVTAGDLWSPARLGAIWHFQRGQYDYLLKEYVNSPYPNR